MGKQGQRQQRDLIGLSCMMSQALVHWEEANISLGKALLTELCGKNALVERMNAFAHFFSHLSASSNVIMKFHFRVLKMSERKRDPLASKSRQAISCGSRLPNRGLVGLSSCDLICGYAKKGGTKAIMEYFASVSEIIYDHILKLMKKCEQAEPKICEGGLCVIMNGMSSKSINKDIFRIYFLLLRLKQDFSVWRILMTEITDA